MPQVQLTIAVTRIDGGNFYFVSPIVRLILAKQTKLNSYFYRTSILAFSPNHLNLVYNVFVFSFSIFKTH